MSQGALKLFGMACSAVSLKTAFDANTRWNNHIDSMTPEERQRHAERETALSKANPAYAAESHSIFDVAYRRSCEQRYSEPSEPKTTTVYRLSFKYR